MIVAFEKNPLQNGVKRELEEYSNDLETRVKNEFDSREIKTGTRTSTTNNAGGLWIANPNDITVLSVELRSVQDTSVYEVETTLVSTSSSLNLVIRKGGSSYKNKEATVVYHFIVK